MWASRTSKLDALKNPWVASALLLGIYVVLSLLMSPRGYLGTDTGAKVATLDLMAANDTAEPDLGYWAETWDPDGRLHPIYDTGRTETGWVHVTTLPMLELARPLYSLGGYRLALVLPMLGSVAAAHACRAVARRLSDDDAGWLAFWASGLASPMAVYALDFWEHAPGVACMVGATALLLAVLDQERPVLRSVAAGMLLGLSATMRTETFVYALVLVGGASVALLLRRAVQTAIVTGLSSVTGFAVVWAGNHLLERAVGGAPRGSRAAGAARGGLSELGDRAQEAVITTLALRPQRLSSVVVLGCAFAGLLMLAWVKGRAGDDRLGYLALVGAWLMAVLVILKGLGFVPGLLAATPVAAVAMTARPSTHAHRYVVGCAVAALPLVWAFQFLGGAGPQWGGRYTLTSALLLATAGAVVASQGPRWLRVGTVALAVLVTGSGVLWLRERSNAIDDYFDRLVALEEDVVVARNGFFIREGGPAYAERRWLTAVTDEDLALVPDLVRRAGLGSFAVIDAAPLPNDLSGARAAGTEETRLLSAILYIHSYEIVD